MNFSLISNLKKVDPEVVKNNWKDLFFSYSIEQQENLSSVLQATNITKEIDMVKMEMAAIDLLQNNKSGYTGIIDILSKGNLETFHKRLGISDSDLFNRSETGKRDVYVSSLTEDVANFIAKLWDAVRNAIQKVYDWSNNLYSDNSKIGLCKAQFETVLSTLQSKGDVTITVDMTDPQDLHVKIASILKLYQVLEELVAGAGQTVASGQLTEKSLQDQLLGKMQRANIADIKYEIGNNPSSSSFRFNGISSGRIEFKDATNEITKIKTEFEAILGKIEALNKAIAAFAQNITTAQTQYKCNTDCAAAVGNISSSTQVITKGIVSINSYVSEVIANAILDILGKIATAIGAMPDAPKPQEPPQPPRQITPMPTEQQQQPTQTEQPAQQPQPQAQNNEAQQ